MKLPAGVSEQKLIEWVAESSRARTRTLGHGYQGQVLLYELSDPPLVIKTALGRGVAGALRRFMLRREERAYELLAGVDGVPRAYGLLAGQHLVLEFVRGTPYREATIRDRRAFSERAFALVQRIHERGVAHCDLKKKDNIIVLEGEHPCFIDFGAAVRRPRGFAPLRGYLFRVGCVFDRNACRKLRYNRPLSKLDEIELEGFERTAIERISRWFRHRRNALRRWKAARQGEKRS